jgi:hypothetical protein
VSVPGSGNGANSQADSAGSIPVTRSNVKAQVRGWSSSLGLDRSRVASVSPPVTLPPFSFSRTLRRSVTGVINGHAARDSHCVGSRAGDARGQLPGPVPGSPVPLLSPVTEPDAEVLASVP